MKKAFIILLILFLGIKTPIFAGNDVCFIYINGSNTDDEKSTEWYENGVRKLHTVLRKKFINNSTIKKYYSTREGFEISEEPVIFLWGNKTSNDLNFVKSRLDISKAISSVAAYTVRSLITQYLHDAIWVQKPHNMLSVLEDLNALVKIQADKGQDVILYGYSAGSFVTYEYMFNKLRFLNLQRMFKSIGADDEFIQFVEENPMKDTCISALSYDYAGLGTVSSEGNIILNQDKEQLKKNYLKMDEMTELACAPEGKFRGIVNFASPLALFYSDLSDAGYELNYYNKYMMKYLYENGIFWITVNFREDPLGLPISRNLTVQEVENLIDIELENPTGVIYDDSGVWSKRIFAVAHTSYWSARRTFSNAVVKSFVNGYKFQYDEKYQNKVLKKNSKKSELLYEGVQRSKNL